MFIIGSLENSFYSCGCYDVTVTVIVKILTVGYGTSWTDPAKSTDAFARQRVT